MRVDAITASVDAIDNWLLLAIGPVREDEAQSKITVAQCFPRVPTSRSARGS
jgi:hypothetical protein